jgi:hypothetical protein
MINDRYCPKIFICKYILGNIREEEVVKIFGLNENPRGII